jgi:hypothetical protein
MEIDQQGLERIGHNSRESTSVVMARKRRDSTLQILGCQLAIRISLHGGVLQKFNSFASVHQNGGIAEREERGIVAIHRQKIPYRNSLLQAFITGGE